LPKDYVITLGDIRRHEVQALFAGLSRRDWWATEKAANEMRDKIDQLLTDQHLKEQKKK
jgi:hypothetical protein